VIMDVLIENGRVLAPDGFVDGNVAIEGGVITSVGSSLSSARRRIDARGAYVLPGLIDIHGDAFERQLMPRPGVHFPLDIALMETDKQLITNGITTAYHGVTLSWEPGLRSADAFRKFMCVHEGLKSHYTSDVRLHLRFETANVGMVEETAGWIAEGRIDALAFNDHLPHIRRYRKSPDKMGVYAGRSGMNLDDFLSLFERVARDADEGQAAGIEHLAKAARNAGVPMLSHDDANEETRQHFHDLGCHIAEFPMGDVTAAAAKVLGDPIVLGAPNVVRGGSHTGLQSAADAVAKDLCDVLASDYYYPALLNAPFILAELGKMPLHESWKLVSTNAADALGLRDRGRIASGQRADVIVLSEDGPVPILKATISAGHVCSF